MVRIAKWPRKFAAAALALALSLPAVASASDPVPTMPARPGAGAPAAQEPRFSRQQAVALAREIFAIPADLGEPNVNLNQSSQPRSRSVWSLYWRTPDKKLPFLTYSVEIDAMTGEILRYHFDRQTEDQEPELAYTRGQAQELAAGWMERLAPRYKGAVRLRERRLEPGYFYGGPATHSYFWERLADGVPVAGDGVNIGVDARTGELRSFSLQWRTDLKLAGAGQSIGQGAAEDIYKTDLRMVLTYARFYKPGLEKPEWRLVYLPLGFRYPMVDAITGKLLDTWGQPADLTPWLNLSGLPAPARAYQKPAAPLTREQALAMAMAVTGRTDVPNESGYHEQMEPTPTKMWRFGWYKPGPMASGDRNVNVTIDAERGVVLNFSSWGPWEPGEKAAPPKVKEADARQTAVNFLLTHRPDLAPSLKLLPASYDRPVKLQNLEPQRTWNFGFQVHVGGIPLLHHQVRIEVDAATGDVISLWADEALQVNPADLPATTGLLEPGAAMAAFLKYEGLVLAWHVLGEQWDSPEVPEARLVWAPDTFSGMDYVDAGTGHILDGQGRDLVEMSQKPTDIAGHPYEKEIELLLARNIFELKGGRVYPQFNVTRGEAARWLVLVRGMRPLRGFDFYGAMGAGEPAQRLAASADAPYFGAALQSGIITAAELSVGSPELTVTREEFALWAVRAMGYGAIARMGVTIPANYSDASKIGAAYRNAVAILAGLNVLPTGGEFRPGDRLNRGDAARILYAVSTEGKR